MYFVLAVEWPVDWSLSKEGQMKERSDLPWTGGTQAGWPRSAALAAGPLGGQLTAVHMELWQRQEL